MKPTAEELAEMWNRDLKAAIGELERRVKTLGDRLEERGEELVEVKSQSEVWRRMADVNGRLLGNANRRIAELESQLAQQVKPCEVDWEGLAKIAHNAWYDQQDDRTWNNRGTAQSWWFKTARAVITAYETRKSEASDGD